MNRLRLHLPSGVVSAAMLLAILVLGIAVAPLNAQQGHPLTGSWSGERSIDGQNSRILMVLDLQPDQSFTGYIVERGARLPLSTVTLNPDDWTVAIAASGKDRAGNDLAYRIEASIENLGSHNNRVLDGTWREGNASGDFRVRIN